MSTQRIESGKLKHSVLPLGEITGQSADISGNLSVFSFRGSVPSVTCFNCGS